MKQDSKLKLGLYNLKQDTSGPLSSLSGVLYDTVRSLVVSQSGVWLFAIHLSRIHRRS